MSTGVQKSRIRVGLAQINNSFSIQNYLPLSVGILQAYARSHLENPDDYEFLVPIHRRMPVAEAVQRLQAVVLDLFYNVWEVYQSALIGRPIPIETRSFTYRIDQTNQTWSSWEEWCQEVVWYGNRMGAVREYGRNITTCRALLSSMKYRRLGSGLQVSEMGFGAWATPWMGHWPTALPTNRNRWAP